MGCVNDWDWGNVSTVVQGLIMDEGADGLWKLLVGATTMDGWTGPRYPNTSTPSNAFNFSRAWTGDCGDSGCLFRLDHDPGEHEDVAVRFPQRLADMLSALSALNRSSFSPRRGPGEADRAVVAAACDAAAERHGGFWGPFM